MGKRWRIGAAATLLVGGLGCGETSGVADAGTDAAALPCPPPDPQLQVAIHVLGNSSLEIGLDTDAAWVSGSYSGALDVSGAPLAAPDGAALVAMVDGACDSEIRLYSIWGDEMRFAPEVLRGRPGGGLVIAGNDATDRPAGLMVPDDYVAWLDASGRVEHAIGGLRNVSATNLTVSADGVAESVVARRPGEVYDLGAGEQAVEAPPNVERIYISRVDVDSGVAFDVEVADVSMIPLSRRSPRAYAGPDESRWVVTGGIISIGGVVPADVSRDSVAMIRVLVDGTIGTFRWGSYTPDGAGGFIGQVRPRDTLDPGDGTTITGPHTLRYDGEGNLSWAHPDTGVRWERNYVIAQPPLPSWPFSGPPLSAPALDSMAVAAIDVETGDVRWWRGFPSEPAPEVHFAGTIVRADGGLWWWAFSNGELDLGDARIAAAPSRLIVAGFDRDGATDVLEEIPVRPGGNGDFLVGGDRVLYVMAATVGGTHLARVEVGAGFQSLELPVVRDWAATNERVLLKVEPTEAVTIGGVHLAEGGTAVLDLRFAAP